MAKTPKKQPKKSDFAKSATFSNLGPYLAVKTISRVDMHLLSPK
jgi:hypothetical protein